MTPNHLDAPTAETSGRLRCGPATLPTSAAAEPATHCVDRKQRAPRPRTGSAKQGSSATLSRQPLPRSSTGRSPDISSIAAPLSIPSCVSRAETSVAPGGLEDVIPERARDTVMAGPPGRRAEPGVMQAVPALAPPEPAALSAPVVDRVVCDRIAEIAGHDAESQRACRPPSTNDPRRQIDQCGDENHADERW